MKMVNIAVLGGAGFIGRHLAAKLAQLGHEVVAFDNLTRGTKKPITDVKLLLGDIRDANSITHALQDADILINLAAISSVRRAEEIAQETREINATSLWNLMKLAKKAGVQRVLQASSREVYGDPQMLPVNETHPRGGINVYGKSKEDAEYILQKAEADYDIPVGLLRLANVIGPWDINDGRVIPRWLTLARSGKPLTVIGGTDKSLDFIPVDYVVEAFIRAATIATPLTTSTPINVGSGQSITLACVAERIRDLYPQTSVIFEPSKVKEVARFAADTSRMQTILGITPPSDPLIGMDSFEFIEPVLH